MFIQISAERNYEEGHSGVKTLWRKTGSEVVPNARETVRTGVLLREMCRKKDRLFAACTGCRQQMYLKRGTFIVLISSGERICRIRKTVLRARRLAMQFRQRPAGVKRDFEQCFVKLEIEGWWCCLRAPLSHSRDIYQPKLLK